MGWRSRSTEPGAGRARRLQLGACALLGVAAAAAQAPSTVSPAAAAAGLGNANNNVPVSWSPCTYQQVHSVASFTSSAPLVATRLALRMATGFANRPGQTVDLELFLAESPNDAGSASAAFGNNVVPGTEVAVLPRQLIALPQVPDHSWSVALPFTTPFLFTGRAHLSWRVNNFGNGNGNGFFNYPLDAWSPNGTSTTLGAGCAAAGGSGPAVIAATVPAPGQTARFHGLSMVAPGGLPAFLVLGNSATRFAGVPLPLDLTPLGAPGCALQVNWLALVPGVTSTGATGAVALDVPLPGDPALSGSTLLAQYLFVDPTANALGVFTTPGLSAQIGTAHAVTRIHGLSGPGLTTGTVQAQYGLAIELR